MKIFTLTLLIVLFCSNATALEMSCTKAESLEAESSVLKLNTWEDIYNSYKMFRHCDDGAIAEGYSEAVVRMLAYRWSRLPVFIHSAQADKDFLGFVVRHVDATTNKRDLDIIIVNSSKHCPKSATTVCSIIENTAKKAIRELEKKRN